MTQYPLNICRTTSNNTSFWWSERHEREGGRGGRGWGAGGGGRGGLGREWVGKVREY